MRTENNFSSTERNISEQAVRYVQQHAKEIVEKFITSDVSPVEGKAISIFMAGSPGAGKTELSKHFISSIESQGYSKIVRIDPDDIRELLPEYTGNNSYLFQRAVARGVEKIHDCVLSKNFNFLLDGTLSDVTKAESNINRSLDKGRFVIIMYVYLDPFIAWEITRARELKDKRHIPKEAFVKHLFGARETVGLLKKKYGGKIGVLLAKKQSVEHVDDFGVVEDVKDIDKLVNIEYSSRSLLKKLL